MSYPATAGYPVLYQVGRKTCVFDAEYMSKPQRFRPTDIRYNPGFRVKSGMTAADGLPNNTDGRINEGF
jgi:hypothetical protein